MILSKTALKQIIPPYILQDYILRFDNIVFLFTVCTLLRYKVSSSSQRSLPEENMHFSETCFRFKNTHFYTIFKHWPLMTTFAFHQHNFTKMLSFRSKIWDCTIVFAIFGQELNLFIHPKFTLEKKYCGA